MTYDEALASIVRYEVEMPDLNEGDDWFVKIMATPLQLTDDDGLPVDDWAVCVAWHCWVRSSKTSSPGSGG